jgi:hypothetical protein
MTKKDVAIIAGPIVGAAVYAAANFAVTKIKERRDNKAVVEEATPIESVKTEKKD